MGMRRLSKGRLKARIALGLAFATACVAAVAGGAQEQAASDVVRVRLGGDLSETRIVIDLRRSTHGQVDSLGGSKIALTLSDVSAGDLQGPGRGLVHAWRLERSAGQTRLSLDLAAAAAVERRFLLPPADGVSAYRYVLDLTAIKAPAAVAQSQAKPQLLAATVQLPPVDASHGGRKVIVLDPGHGGKDPGAQGAKSDEKDVTLAAALALKARLERTGRYQVVMTRRTDTYIPLDERVKIARSADADLFLSLHADSGSDPATHGASVYTLSERGAARVGSVLGHDEWFLQEARQDDDQAVGQILLDLTQRSTRNKSALFAQTLIDRVGDQAPLLARSRRDASYFVLLAPDVPAALLEMGFITNPADEARLDDPAARSVLMDRVAQAIDAYFAGQTKLAAR